MRRRYRPIPKAPAWLEEFDRAEAERQRERYPEVPPAPDWFGALVADYWERLDAEILAVQAAERAVGAALAAAQAQADARAERLAQRRLRRRERVFGVPAILEALGAGSEESAR